MVTNEIPAWLTRYLKDDASAQITAAVREVEATTSGEIVPMVVRRSAVTGHVLPVVLLALLAVALGFADAWQQPVTLIPGISVLCVLVLAAWGLSHIPWVRRFCTSDRDLTAQVLQRAALEFYESGLNKTADATGILIFVSLAERRALVLADRTIAGRLPPATWNDAVNLVIAGIRAGDLGKGMADAIRSCGAIVAPHFPVKPGDVNELTDALIIKE